MAARKRSGSGSKWQFREKVVQIYESFFKGEDPTRTNPNFWNELFLLKPKVPQLEAEVQKLSPEQLMGLKDNMNMLLSQCVDTLGHEHRIRVVYALQTLCAIISAVYKKTSGESGFDVISLLMGLEQAKQHMQALMVHINTFLSGDYPTSLKSLCLKLLLVLITGTDNVSQNTLLEDVMISVFEALVQLLCDPVTRAAHGHDVVIILALLVNYRKHEATNPYIVKLSILDDELALNGYGQVITVSLSEFCRQYTAQNADSHSGWLSSFTNMMGSMFVSEDGGTRTQQIRANNAVLVALYEGVHLNRNFITTLAYTQTDGSLPPSPSSTLSPHATPPSDAAAFDMLAQPSNLLGTFFQYCSIVMQDTKCESSVNNVKLCFIILTCISEDQYANSLMHDANLSFKVLLHRMPMRHRKLTADRIAPSQPLAATLLDLLVEFIMSHMMKKFPMELYLQCVGVIHRLLCYQKRCRVRLTYHWKELWSALISLVKFLMTNENHLAKKMNIFNLALQVVNMLNLFITYGDTFLPSTNTYDELYYEIIRMRQTFEDLYSMAMRCSTVHPDFKDSALRLVKSLFNVRAIINHFYPKINIWLEGQGVSTPSEDQILEVVCKNYDSLTLKLQDNLDQYERYSEKPYHAAFFTAMVRNVVIDTRQSIDFTSMDLQVILQDFSSIL